jgi:hypothetical protein
MIIKELRARYAETFGDVANFWVSQPTINPRSRS